MIKAAELRIGNRLNYTGLGNSSYPSGLITVEEVLSDGVNRSQGDGTVYEYEKLEGIPLTPEILLKSGLIVEWRNNWIKPDAKGENPWSFSFYLSNNKVHLVMAFEDIGMSEPATKLHQLQNLYFALTGEELEVKL